MTDSPNPAAATPPNLPTFNVRLSQEVIQAIVALVLPIYSIESCRQLPSGKSFNNRIYFIEAVDARNHDRQSLVLKVSGHYFGARKVQNETGSLLLLQKYCPSVPVPRIVAWSDDGSIICTTEGRSFDTANDADAPSDKHAAAFSEHSWILITRLPGRVLSEQDLSSAYGPDLIRQAARHLATWRTSVPSPGCIGNIRYQEATGSASADMVFDLLNGHNTPLFTPGGLLLCHRYEPAPLPTPLSYFSYALQDQKDHLTSFAPLHSLRVKIEHDIQALIDDLPRLPFLQDYATSLMQQEPDVIKFTHFDFAPRNILVTDDCNEHSTVDTKSTPQITGIVDFEFSGFLPSVDEFLNMVNRQATDWTPPQYEILVQEMARLGCEVPHLASSKHHDPVCTIDSKGSCACDFRAFEGLCELVNVIGDVAPWRIQENSHTEEELQNEVERATESVRDGIRKLNGFLD